MSSMAAPIQRAGERATGVIVIAGSSARLTAQRAAKSGPALLKAAEELSITGPASPAAEVGQRRYLGQRNGSARRTAASACPRAQGGLSEAVAGPYPATRFR
jgi:hypothetical protein